tara:strand:+ start:3027 stop:3845 length:819 start_codon:yes stop_codon:yes gene_type:complete
MQSIYKSSFEPTTPLITIVTVVKNGRHYIQETMNSVFSQEYKNIEYIVVDGCSSDGTSEIIHRNLDKIDLLISEEDDGIYSAMNKGINAANGVFIGFLNASDLLYPQTILNLVNAFKKDDFDFSLGPAEIEDLNTGKTFTSEPLKSFQIQSDQCIGMPSPHLAIYIKTKLIKELGKFDIQYKLSADYDLMLKVINGSYKAWYFKQPVGAFRLGGLSGSFRTQVENFSILQKYHIPLYKIIFITGRSILALGIKKILAEGSFNRLKYYFTKNN